ncbi:hypothetical protein [Ramlibacter sp. AN1133]|uniref:hypothetical protein n=1 Tax=Ramlibacter sp. AN1133 TaxID=3133429 RepID=UPI0030C2931C
MPGPRVLLASMAALAVLAGCATPPRPGTAVPFEPVGAAPAADAGSVLVLLRLHQTLHGVAAAQPKALSTWIANVDRAEALHRIDSDPLAPALAAQGWRAWRLAPGAYHFVVAGYAGQGVPPRILLDRYRFQVNASAPALSLGSLSYACEPAWWFEALCPEAATVADELPAAGLVLAASGGHGIARGSLARSPPLPRLAASETLLMAGDAPAVRSVHDFLAQARAERVVPVAVGAQMLVALAPLGPLAVVVALPATAFAGATVAIHGKHLEDKAQCLQRIWDQRADTVARDSLAAALRRMAGGSESAPAGAPQPLVAAEAAVRYRHLLALDVQRLAVASCHPSQPWLPDPRGKRFCLEAAVRARVYATLAREPLGDEVFAVVPEHRVGYEFEPSGWPIPPAYSYETLLSNRRAVGRSYDDYCGAGGFERVEADLRALFDAMVPELLARYGIVR